MGKQAGLIDRLLESILNLVYDPEKRNIMLLFLLAFILRFIAARNMGGNPDDIGHGVWAIGALNSDKIANWSQSNIIWYYIVDIFYRIFGVNQIGARFAEILFGSALVLITFLFVKRLLNSSKIAYISALLIAISPMMIKNTLPEMDVAVSFFIIFAAYFFLIFQENRSSKNLALCAMMLAIGIMIKLYVLFIAFSFFIILVILLRKDLKQKTNLKLIFIFLAVIGLALIPGFINNYLLYKDKGIVDFVFTTALNIGREKAAQFYAGFAGWNPPYSDYIGFFFGKQINFGGENATGINALPGFIVLVWHLIKADPILMLLGFFGALLLLKINRNYILSIIILILPTFIYLGARIPMLKHLIWISVLLVPCSAYCLVTLSDKFKVGLKYISLILVIFSLIYLGTTFSGITHFYSESATSQIVDYNDKITNNYLVVADSRIFRGMIHWDFYGTNYIESAQFISLMGEFEKYSTNKAVIPVYYIECAIDDCGWGTIADQPDFNQSMEQLTSQFADISTLEKEIFEIDRNKIYIPLITPSQKILTYKIYKTNINIDPQIFQVLKQTHHFFLYPIGYDRTISNIFDDYKISGFFDQILYKLAWVITWIAIFLALCSIPYIFYKFIKD